MAGAPGAGAENVDPTQWPAVPGLDPFIETTAHSIRFAGPDRYQTNLALNLALRGTGDFPFDTPDPTSGGAANLAAADDWWGAGTCPRSILVVAGDTFADALAAASLSDPTDQSSQPRVQRVAAADPLFDPIGGFDRPDTAFAPIVVTHSARQGATDLAQTARLTASDFAAGGCTTAREAIIVGGLDAVPVGVASELVELGYREVFRVSGADRYDTAARVATALGTGAPPDPGTSCEDPDVTDGDARMGWYGNAVAEYRPTATECQLLPRAVVLADGFTGADALAAGWWTSFWQVPVLLTAPDGSLPPATRTTLQTLDVNSIVVLGGTDRIPEATVDEAKELSGAVAGRIAGPDRYATSVEMAKQFGGWHPTGEGADFQNDMVCLAASSGVGPTASGWPDALALGPWCARLPHSPRPVVGPVRALPPVEGVAEGAVLVGDRPPRHRAVPILLSAPAGGLPGATSAFLGASFGAGGWCRAVGSPSDCIQPGFAVGTGGPGVLGFGALAEAATLVSGGTYLVSPDTEPVLRGAFFTELDLTPVFSPVGGETLARVCHGRGDLLQLRWLELAGDVEPRDPAGTDLLASGAYRDAGTPGSAPTCVQFAPEPAARVSLRGTSPSGAVARSSAFDPTAGRLRLSSALSQEASVSGGDQRVTIAASGSLAGQPVQVEVERALLGASLGEVRLVLERFSERRSTVTGTVRLVAGGRDLQGTVTGEALEEGQGWRVRGRVALRVGEVSYAGGFACDFFAGPAGGEITWRLDGLPAADGPP